MSKQVHFVIVVDLGTGEKFIDDDTLTARFDDGSTWDTDTQEWIEEEEEDYERALAILNDKEIELG